MSVTYEVAMKWGKKEAMEVIEVDCEWPPTAEEKMSGFRSGEPEIGKPSLTTHNVEQAIELLRKRGFSVEKSPIGFYLGGKEVTAIDLINVAFHGKKLP